MFRGGIDMVEGEMADKAGNFDASIRLV